jgi:uroporphyrinogen-III synthase
MPPNPSPARRRVLVTRPQDDAAETAARLAALGYEAIEAPLLTIRFREGGPVALDGVQALLVTSANGIRALARRTQLRDVPVFAVGKQSAQAARAAGFPRIEDAEGDAEALAALVARRLSPADGSLLHAAGADTRGSLAERLSGRGFTVRTQVLYDAVAADMLPLSVREFLAQGAIGAVLFFSPRTAQIFVQLVQTAALMPACRAISALCISRATADALAPLACHDIRVARHPEQDAVMALLD